MVQENDTAGPKVEPFSMAMQAAVHGLGAALVRGYSAQIELERGSLIKPIGGTFASGSSCFLAYPESAEAPSPFHVFREWSSVRSAAARKGEQRSRLTKCDEPRESRSSVRHAPDLGPMRMETHQ